MPNLPVADGRDTLEFSAGLVAKGSRVGSGVALPGIGPLEMESYQLVNASITYRFPSFEVAAFATNLFDSNGRYSTSVQCVETTCGDPDNVSTTGGVFYDYVIKPRTVGLKVGFDF